jgi:LPPG:FO 2-phospho-L-lactate transferase
VLDALRSARAILVCPSNPVVSIAPILALSGVPEAIAAARAPVVAVSPIVGGAAIKGPAAQLLRGIGCEVSARGVARLYAPWIDGIVIDQRDRDQIADIEALGLACRAVDTIMANPDVARSLASTVLELSLALAGAR